MNTIAEGKFQDTNQIFEKPGNEIDFEVKKKDAENLKLLILEDIKNKFKF